VDKTKNTQPECNQHPVSAFLKGSKTGQMYNDGIHSNPQGKKEGSL
jgi:hypothetical protein